MDLKASPSKYPWMKQLNKTLAYAVIAVLLGTVTMCAPLALLGPEAGSSPYLQSGLDNESAYQENRNLLDNSSFDFNQSGGTYSPPNNVYTLSTEPSFAAAPRLWKGRETVLPVGTGAAVFCYNPCR